MSESSGLPPEQEAVRRLLADARHDGPPPPDVVARLDETLASLVAERDRHRRATEPTTVAGTRRRPRLPADAAWRASACWPPPPSSSPGVALGQALPRGGQRRQRVECRLGSPTLAADVPARARRRRRLERRRRRGQDDLADSEPAPESLRRASCQPGLAGTCRRCSPTTTPTSTTSCSALRADVTPTRPQRRQSLDALRGCDVRRSGPRGRRGGRAGRRRVGPGRVPSPRRGGAGRRALRLRRPRAGAYDHAARALSGPGRVRNNGRLRSVEDDVPHQTRSSRQQESLTHMSTSTETRNVIIIGSGPSGYTAAVYAARASLNPLVFEGSVTAGGALMNTTEVENFPGFRDGIMGPALMDEMRAQAERFGAELVSDDVVEVDLTGDVKVVKTATDTYTARSVILVHRLGLPQARPAARGGALRPRRLVVRDLRRLLLPRAGHRRRRRRRLRRSRRPPSSPASARRST